MANLANYQTFSHCRLFPDAKLESIIDLGFAPLANSFQDDKFEKAPEAPLELCFSERAACAQLSVTVAPTQLFSQYLWVTGTSAAAEKYSFEFCKKLLGEHPGAKKIAEVASNDGTFLRPFLECGLEVLGIDPAKNIAQTANSVGIPTEVRFFDNRAAVELKTKYGSFDLVVARNVLPHVPDSREIISGMAQLLSADGIGAIEFHSARTIFEELHYDSIYHEHVFYLTLTCLSKLLQSCGLILFDVFKSPISGGSMVVLFSKIQKEKRVSLKNELAEEEKSGVLTFKGWEKFALQVRQHSEKFRNLLNCEQKLGSRLVGYGASARSMTLIHASGTAAKIDQIIDNNPLKQGLFSSTGNIPIVSGDTINFRNKNFSIILLAWNFTEELLALLKERHNYSGNIIIPLPGPPRVVRM